VKIERRRGMHAGAARAAVENLGRSLAIEWAEKGVRWGSMTS